MAQILLLAVYYTNEKTFIFQYLNVDENAYRIWNTLEIRIAREIFRRRS